MHILIIGAKGMLGQALAETFADQQLTLWDREDIDITKPEEYGLQMTEIFPDLVINAAALNDVDGIEENAELAEMVNGNAVGSIADICFVLGILMVHYSSDYIFSGTKQDGYTERDRPDPVNAYGRTKLLGEHTLRHATDEYYLIRTSRLFGSMGSAEGAKKSFVDKVIEKAKADGKVELIDAEVSSPTYVKDLAARTRDLLAQRKPLGVYHVTNSGGCTWYEFGKTALEIAGVQAEVRVMAPDALGRAAQRPAYSILKNTKLEPMRSWQDALEEYLHKRE